VSVATSARDFHVVADGFTLLESPRWHQDALWFVDVFEGIVLRVDVAGRTEVVCEVEGRPSGLGFDPSGRLLVVSMRNRRVLRLDASGLVTHCDLGDFVSAAPNDMVVDGHGRAYVGNLGGEPEAGPVPLTHLVMVDPEGHASRVGDALAYPNGMAMTVDGSTLIVAESLAARLSAFAIQDNGTLGNRWTWARLGPKPPSTSLAAAVAAQSVIPDGIALDHAGAAWVANANGGVIRVAEGGHILERIAVRGRSVYAVGLGNEGSTLYLCVAPSIPELQQGVRGQAALLACDVSRSSASERARQRHAVRNRRTQ
jgi:sugar lactone lactonase YvrE